MRLSRRGWASRSSTLAASANRRTVCGVQAESAGDLGAGDAVGEELVYRCVARSAASRGERVGLFGGHGDQDAGVGQGVEVLVGRAQVVQFVGIAQADRAQAP